MGAVCRAGGCRHGRGRIHGQPEAADRRSRRRRSGTARRLALQRRQRLHHRPLLAVQRPVRGDGEDRAGRLPELPDPDPRRSPGLGPAAASGRADHRVADQRGPADHRRHLRGQSEVPQPAAQPGRAQLRRPAGVGEQSRAVQHRLLADAGDRLPEGPQGADTEGSLGDRGEIRCGEQHA
ncbi:hypothetical protein D3C81_1350960 [compost metagenome]